jgi:hypothetical protein
VRDLAQRLLDMGEYDQQLVRLAWARGAGAGEDRVSQALVKLASKHGVRRDATSRGTLMLPSLRARLDGDVEEARYELAEALGLTVEDGGHAFQRSANPRVTTCERCAKTEEAHP